MTKVLNCDQEKLNVLNNLLGEQLEDLLDHLGVRYRRVGRILIGACPIHGGDNPTAMNVYLQGDEVAGYWTCNTWHCERFFKQNIIGFAHGVLSHEQAGWCKQGDRRHRFDNTLDFLCKFANIKFAELQVDLAATEKARFVSSVRRLNRRVKQGINTGITRDRVRKSLILPSHYFRGRGFSEKILDEFDIGDCVNVGKPMFERAVCPVYDDSGTFLIGCVGRSIYEQCENCKLWHGPSIPCSIAQNSPDVFCKWKNSENFNAGSNFYGFWKAKKYIEESGVVIIVESQASVLRLHENGLRNTIGMFGSAFTEEQRVILETSGALSLIVLTDNDKAGRAAAEKIKSECGRLYRLYFPKFSGKDAGELNTDQITKEIRPILDKLNENKISRV